MQDKDDLISEIKGKQIEVTIDLLKKLKGYGLMELEYIAKETLHLSNSVFDSISNFDDKSAMCLYSYNIHTCVRVMYNFDEEIDLFSDTDLRKAKASIYDISIE